MSDQRSTKVLIAEARRIAAAAPVMAPILTALADRLAALDSNEDRYRKHGGSCSHKFIIQETGRCLECNALVEADVPV